MKINTQILKTVVIALLISATCSLEAMEENFGNTNLEESKLVWQPSGNAASINNSDSQQLAATLKKRRLKHRNVILGSLLTLMMVAGIAYVVYHYYGILDNTCLKMENACNNATQQLPNVEKSIEPVIDFIKNANKFMKNCPKSSSKFTAQMLEFAEKCCAEQP